MPNIHEARISSGPMVNNLLINPGFEVWQRGAGTFTAPTLALQATADEWFSWEAAGATLTVDRSSTRLYGSYGFRADHVLGNGPSYVGRQSIESAYGLEDKWVTYSVWVKCPREGTVTLEIVDNDSGGDDFTRSAPNVGGPGWEQMTLLKKVSTGLVSPGATVFPHGFPLLCQARLAESATVYLDGAVFTEGYYPEGVPFVPPNPAEDQERCQRFYQTSGGESRSTGIWRQDVVSGSQYWLDKVFQTPMQATPTITLVNGGASGFGVGVGTVQLDRKGFKEYRQATTTSAASYFWTYWEAEVP